MDIELDQVLCTVLSLEEDYPALSPPLRSQDHTSGHFYTVTDFSSVKEDPECRHQACILQQASCELYSVLGLQQESQIRQNVNQNVPNTTSDVTSSAEVEENRQDRPLKRKYSYDVQDGCKKPRVEIYNQKTMSSSARSRKKTVYTNEQTTFLQNQFESNPYPDFVHRCRISQITGILEPRIQLWFQNRRARHPLRTNRFLENKKKLPSVSGEVKTPQDLYRLY